MDKDTARKDRQSVEHLIAFILSDKRLSAEIVHQWLELNNYLLCQKDFIGCINGQEYLDNLTNRGDCAKQP